MGVLRLFCVIFFCFFIVSCGYIKIERPQDPGEPDCPVCQMEQQQE